MSNYHPLSKNTEQYLLFEYQRYLLHIFNFKIMKALSHYFLSRPSHCRLICPHHPLPTHAVNAEKLFNLPVTSYPDLLFIEQQLEKLERIFACYREQQDTVRSLCMLAFLCRQCSRARLLRFCHVVTRWPEFSFSRFVSTIVPFDLTRGGVVGPQVRSWAATRWADLHIDTLNRGVEAFLKQLKALPDDLKKMPTCRLVEEKLAAFQESGAHSAGWSARERVASQISSPLHLLIPNHSSPTSHAIRRIFTTAWNIVLLNHPAHIFAFLDFAVM
jgi:hypothetical protein